MDPWYLIVRTPVPTCDIYPVGDNTDPDVTTAYVAAARIIHQVPGGWLDIPGWDLSLTQGEPHPGLVGTRRDSPPTV